MVGCVETSIFNLQTSKRKNLPKFSAGSTVLADLLVLQIPLSGYQPRVLRKTGQGA